MARKTTGQFKEEVENICGSEYKVLSEYVNNKTKIDMFHEKCKSIYSVRPNDFISGYRCSNCNGNKKKTTASFKEEIYQLVGNEYSILGEYKNNSTEIKFIHNDCGFEFGMIPSGFTSKGYRCTKCALERRTNVISRTHEEFCDLLKNKTDDYEVLSEYYNSHTKITLKHRECGHEYEVKPYLFLSGNRCPNCFKNHKKTTEIYKKEVYDKVQDDYEVLGIYENAFTKIDMLHSECGKIYNVTPHDFLKGNRCSCVDISKGELRISKFLDDNNIVYETQKTFDGCKNKNHLPFDFYLKDNILIEYDGIQHFEKVDFFGGEDSFERNKKHDSIKNSFAKENNIKLIRIPYWDFNNVETILQKELFQN